MTPNAVIVLAASALLAVLVGGAPFLLAVAAGAASVSQIRDTAAQDRQMPALWVYRLLHQLKGFRLVRNC